MNKLVITTEKDIVYYGYFRDGKAVELYCEKKNSGSILGSIYAARVQKVAEGINGAFLDLTADLAAYYNLSPSRKPLKLSPGHEDRLCGGDLILVQVKKEATGTKLPVADAYVNLSGKYFVFSLEQMGTRISAKIRKKEERDRLKAVVSSWRSGRSDFTYGIIVRTNAAGAAEEELLEELSELGERFDRILKKAGTCPEKSQLYREAPYFIRLARDLPFHELDEILTDDPEILAELEDYYQGDNNARIREKIRLYTDDYSLYLLYRFGHYYDLALCRRTELKSGGSIVIDTTEAMVVVDVNSGSVLKKKKEAQTIFETMNKEAAAEIIYQLRLRNLSGIILIDFINMKEEGSRQRVLEYLKNEAAKDRIPIRVIDFTALFLVEMTRNKVRKSLKEQWAECHPSRI